VPEPGHYYVEFAAPLSRSDFEDDKAIPKDAVNWWGATSIEVETREPKLSRRN
jgi:hypothetical protein